MATNLSVIKKLQMAINTQTSMRITYGTSQFFSYNQDRPINLYSVSQVVRDEDTGKSKKVELYKTTSQLRIVLYLNDLWCLLQGKPLPTDNELWMEVKERDGVEYPKLG